MLDRSLALTITTYAVLAFGLLLFGFPLILALIVATQGGDVAGAGRLSLIPSGDFLANLAQVWEQGDFGRLYVNSLIVGVVTVLGKGALATTTAFAVVFYRFPLRRVVFWVIFASLMLPLEVRIVPTYEVASDLAAPLTGLLGGWGLPVSFRLSLLDSYAGLVLPMVATATGTFLFRQFFQMLPNELVDAAKIDGAGGLRFFVDIALPLSLTTFAALATIMFVASWNQYLWPLLVIGDPDMRPAILGLSHFLPSDGEAPRWHLTMAASLLVMAPPMAIVVLLQRWFVGGILQTGK
jgi:sn-glycerol 3-phosphate transport system permease protein